MAEFYKNKKEVSEIVIIIFKLINIKLINFILVKILTNKIT